MMEAGNVIINMEDGTQLRARMLLDKDGNETSILYDCVTILAKHPDGNWYEVDIQEGSWELPTFH